MVPTMNNLSTREEGIARRVREARVASGLTLKEVGEQLGLSEVGYGHYERGARPFGVEQLFELSRVLGRSIHHLLGLETRLSEEEDELVTLYRQAGREGRDAVLGLARIVAQQHPQEGD